MSQHPKQHRRVESRSEIRTRRQGDEQQARAKRMTGVFFRGEMSTGQPSEFLPFDQCVELKKQGLGEFINRGKHFRRFDLSRSLDDKQYQPSKGGRGDSLNISEALPYEGIGMMGRFVMGDSTARAAVKGWA